MKTCKRCKLDKPSSDFGKNSSTSDGLQKWCRVCLSSYYSSHSDRIKAKSREWLERNKKRALERNREYRARHPEKREGEYQRYKQRHPERIRLTQMKSRLKHYYGMTVGEYQALLLSQGGVCAICRLPPGKCTSGKGRAGVLAVDHDHKTGAVRGLLCALCNNALERIDSIPDWHEHAVSYLRASLRAAA